MSEENKSESFGYNDGQYIKTMTKEEIIERLSEFPGENRAVLIRVDPPHKPWYYLRIDYIGSDTDPDCSDIEIGAIELPEEKFKI